jgi:hypothetical protein
MDHGTIIPLAFLASQIELLQNILDKLHAVSDGSLGAKEKEWPLLPEAYI